MNDLIIDQVKRLISNIRLDELEYTTKRGKNCNFTKYFLPILLRDIHAENLASQNADKKQRELVEKLSGMSTGKIPVEKISFLSNLRLFVSSREKVPNDLKNKVFPIKNLNKIWRLEATPEAMVFDTPTHIHKRARARADTHTYTHAHTHTHIRAHTHAQEETKHETSPLKLNENFMIKIENDKKFQSR